MKGSDMWELLARMNPQEAVAMIFAVITIVVAGMVLGWLIYWDYKKRRLQHEERRLMIDKGMAPPPMVSTPGGTAAQAKLHFQQLQFEERRFMIEKGMGPPPFLFDETPQRTPAETIRRGMIMLCLGLGGSIGYFALEPTNEMKELIGFVAPILAASGVGFIVFAIWAKRQKQEQDGPGKTPTSSTS
jgi:hypothetical protein